MYHMHKTALRYIHHLLIMVHYRFSYNCLLKFKLLEIWRGDFEINDRINYNYVFPLIIIQMVITSVYIIADNLQFLLASHSCSWYMLRVTRCYTNYWWYQDIGGQDDVVVWFSVTCGR